MLLLNGSRLSQVAKAADGARDGRVPPIAVETQKITRSWSVADGDNSVYFLLKQVNYFRLKHVLLNHFQVLSYIPFENEIDAFECILVFFTVCYF